MLLHVWFRLCAGRWPYGSVLSRATGVYLSDMMMYRIERCASLFRRD